MLCRLVAEKLGGMLGQQIIVENRVGAGGNIGAEAAIRAANDGHTLLCSPSTVFTNHLLFSKLSFDPRTFEPVTVFATIWMVGLGAPICPPPISRMFLPLRVPSQAS